LDRIAESLVAQNAITITLRRNGDGKHEQFFVLNKKVLERYMEREKKEEGMMNLQLYVPIVPLDHSIEMTLRINIVENVIDFMAHLNY
jgi:hypothetical protein